MALECHGRQSNPSHTTTPQRGTPEFSKNRHGSSWSFFIACGGRTAYYIGPCWYQAWAYGAHVKVERRGVMCNACKMSEIGGKINPC